MQQRLDDFEQRIRDYQATPQFQALPPDLQQDVLKELTRRYGPSAPTKPVFDSALPKQSYMPAGVSNLFSNLQTAAGNVAGAVAAPFNALEKLHPPSLVEDIGAMGGGIAGGIGGGIPGGMAGAGVGGALGAGIQSGMGGGGMMDVGKAALAGGARGVALEALGGAASKVATPMLRGAVRPVQEFAKRALFGTGGEAAVLAQRSKALAPLIAKIAGGSADVGNPIAEFQGRAGTFLVNVSEGGVAGQQIMRENRRRVSEIGDYIRQKGRDMAGGHILPSDEVADVLALTVSRNYEPAAMQIFNSETDLAKALADTPLTSASPTKMLLSEPERMLEDRARQKFVRDLTKESKFQTPVSSIGHTKPTLSSLGKVPVPELKTAADLVTLRTELRVGGTEFAQTLNKTDRDLLYRRLTKELEELSVGNANAENALDAALRVEADPDLFTKPFLEKLSKRLDVRNAEAVETFGHIMSLGKPGGDRRMLELFSVLGKDEAGEQALGQFRGMTVTYLMNEAARRAGSNPLAMGPHLRKMVLGSGEDAAEAVMTERTMNAVFGAEWVKEFKSLADAMDLLAIRTSTNVGRGVIEFSQYPAAAQLGSGLGAGLFGAGLATGSMSAMVVGGTILLAPPAIGHLMTSQNGIRLLKAGLEAQPGTAHGTRIAARIAQYLDLTNRAKDRELAIEERMIPAEAAPPSTVLHGVGAIPPAQAPSLPANIAQPPLPSVIQPQGPPQMPPPPRP